MNYDRFLTDISKARKPSPLRAFSKYLINPSPSLINMSAGYPNPEMFPFESAVIRLKNGQDLDIPSGKMKTALQYSNSRGLLGLLNWLTNLQRVMHSPPTLSLPDENDSHMELLVTHGSKDGIVRAMECMLNPGDSILLEEPTYPGTLSFMIPQKFNFITIKGDGDGIIPESLLEALSKWTPKQCRSTISKEIPRVLYVIPTAGNPTGTTISVDRRRQIYKIAQDYDLMIIEDDPYYYLSFEGCFPPSFLSLDVDGRVIRTDSFSKILSSGIRIGFASGPKAMIQTMLMHLEATLAQASGISQLMTLELLDRWGIDGFMNHVKEIQTFYQRRRDVAIKYADKWLKSLAEWSVPSGGMFLWITVPGLDDIKKLVCEHLVEKELIVAPGNLFMPDQDAPCRSLRISFSFATEAQINDGFQRLAETIKTELSKQT